MLTFATLLHDVLCAVGKVDEFVKEAMTEEIQGRLAGLVKVECHSGVHSDAKVIIEANGTDWSEAESPNGRLDFDQPSIERNGFRRFNPSHNILEIHLAFYLRSPS